MFKCFVRIFIMALLFVILPTAVYAQNNEKTFPVKKIIFDKYTLDAPGSFNVSVITDKSMTNGYINLNFENETGFKIVISLVGHDDTVKTEDGSLKFTTNFEIEKFKAPGVYSLKSIELQQDNTSLIMYSGKQIEPLKLSFTINNKNQFDVIPPIITDIKIDKLVLKELEKSVISVTISDENSGVSRFNAVITLMNDKGEEQSFSMDNLNFDWNTVIKENVFQGQFVITDENSGKYHITEIKFYDNAENEAVYTYDNATKSLISGNHKYSFSKEINLTNKFDKTNLFTMLDKPMKFTEPMVFSFSAMSNGDLSDVNSLYKDAEIFLICRNMDSYQSYWIHLFNSYWDETTNSYKPLLNKNIYQSISEINKYMPTGIYVADMIMLRTKDNETYFNAPEFAFAVDMPQKTYPIYVSSKEEMLQDLSKVPPTSNIFLYGSREVPKEFLGTIKNQKMTLVLDRDDIQIVLKSADIKNEVPIDIGHVFNITSDFEQYKYWSHNPVDMKTADSIIKLLNNKNAALLMFNKNAELPGTSLIRLPLSHDIREKIGIKDLNVYVYDIKSNKLTLLKSNVNLDVDGYIEIETSYLNNYIITNIKL